MQHDHARSLLAEQLRTLDAGIEQEQRDRDDQDERVSAAAGPLGDVADQGSDVTAAMDRDLTVGTLRRRRQKVEAALVRVDEGVFGQCRVCGTPISDERLEIRPETEFCGEHAGRDTPAGPVEP